MNAIKTEPTLRDIANASKFMASRGGTAEHAESLAWLLAVIRAEERERCAKECERPQMTRGDIGESFVHAGARVCAQRIRALGSELPSVETNDK